MDAFICSTNVIGVDYRRMMCLTNVTGLYPRQATVIYQQLRRALTFMFFYTSQRWLISAQTNKFDFICLNLLFSSTKKLFPSQINLRQPEIFRLSRSSGMLRAQTSFNQSHYEYSEVLPIGSGPRRDDLAWSARVRALFIHVSKCLSKALSKSSLEIGFSLLKRSRTTVIGEDEHLRSGKRTGRVPADRFAVLSTSYGSVFERRKNGRREKGLREQTSARRVRSFVSLWERPDDEFGHQLSRLSGKLTAHFLAASTDYELLVTRRAAADPPPTSPSFIYYFRARD